MQQKEKRSEESQKNLGLVVPTIERAGRALAPYKFLLWWDAYIYVREVKQTSLLLMILFLKTRYLKTIPTNLLMNPTSQSTSPFSNFSLIDSDKLSGKRILSRNNNHSLNDINEMELSILKSYKEQMIRKTEQVDNVDCFFQSLRSDLRRLNDCD